MCCRQQLSSQSRWSSSGTIGGMQISSRAGAYVHGSGAQMAEDMAQREAREAAQRAEIAALAGDAEGKKKELLAQQQALALVEEERQRRLAAVVRMKTAGGGDGGGDGWRGG